MLIARLRLFALVLAAVAAFSSVAQAQRLPAGVTPEHYTLALTPDLKAATFTGTESIDVELAQPAMEITLNAIELKILDVTAEQICDSCGDNSSVKLTGTVTYDVDKEQATLHFPVMLHPEKTTLRLHYTGILNDQLRGFYLSKTARRNYAVTQFEATDARRAFPCWDEPAFKATYDVSLTVDKGDTVIANTPILTDAPLEGDKHTITFQTTPKMSTYLVAFLVGDFKCLSGSADGVPIRACATPDKVQYGKLALDVAEHTLHYYDNYFGIKYPMPKLDMIALPDFEAGAMENFGAITYRETDFLLDDTDASLAQKKRVAVVVTHEMAHQWFGDMVTMQWWDNIWLNEGFATWMESKAANDYKPEWKYKQDDATDLDNALNLDAQATTRTIRATANTPAEINEMFDGIAYEKAGAVIGMVEHYLGEETFREGVHNYLAAHLYANATAEDFWGAQTATSHKPVDKIMQSFVTQPGVPLLVFSSGETTSKKGSPTAPILAAGDPLADKPVPAGKLAPFDQRPPLGVSPAIGNMPAKYVPWKNRNAKVAVGITQSRFYLSPTSTGSREQHWTVPVCFKTVNGPQCEVISDTTQTVAAPTTEFLYANADAKGYYRSEYTKDEQKAIVNHAENGLTPVERLGLVGDTWALMRSGQGNVGGYMDLVNALRHDDEYEVQSSALGKVQAVYDRIADDGDRKQLNAWLVATYAPIYAKLPATGGTDDQQQLRAELFGLLGTAGDEEIVAQAKKIAQKYIADPASVSPEVAPDALQLAAVHGDAALYEQLLALSKSATNPDVQTTALYNLASFTDPKLVMQTLDYLSAGGVRNQDSWILYSILLRHTATREQTWAYIKSHWPQTKAQMTMASGARLVSAAGVFCTVERRDDVQSFFAANPVVSAERTLKKTIDAINDCIQLHSAQEPNLRVWLEHNAPQM
jgi:aminopeptidase N/puromycin-sensitive aminopeptidase